MRTLAHLTSSKRISAWPWGASSWPNTVIGRTTCAPAASIGTSTMHCCRCTGAEASFFPIKMQMAQRASHAPEIQTLRPVTTYSSPSRLTEPAACHATWAPQAAHVFPRVMRCQHNQCIIHTEDSPPRSTTDPRAPWMLVASDDATLGSVIAKHDRTSPRRSGTSHCACCAALP